MNYQFSKKVKEKIDLCKLIISKNQMDLKGFLIGHKIGNTHIIDELFFIDFDKKSLDYLYPILLDTYGAKLLGSFFFGTNNFDAEWFLEDLVLEF